MRKLICFLFLFQVLSTSVLSQTAVCDTIYWKPDTKLSWRDFRAVPDFTTKFGAMTFAGIGYRYQFTTDTLKVQTYCAFLTCRSWTKYDESILLKHEQTHFDISELWRRTFISRLLQMPVHRDSIDASLRALYLEMYRLGAEMDKEYDDQTESCRNKMQQVKWSKKIQVQLEHMSSFQDQGILLPIK